MWVLTKFLLGFDNENLGTRDAETIDQLTELLKGEFGTEDIEYERNMYNSRIYSIHFKAFPNILIIAVQK